MSLSVEKTLCFLVIFLLFFQTKSQVLSNTRANEGTLKHLVHLRVKWKILVNENEEKYGSIMASGSLVKLNWILTAAHNVADRIEYVDGKTTHYLFHKIIVKAGTKDWNDYDEETTQIRTIRRSRKDIVVHELYNPIYGVYGINRYYDVALIYTKQQFYITNTVEPAKLLEPGMDFDAVSKCVIQGWGYNELIHNEDNQLDYSPDQPDHAMQGSVNILNGERCASKYNNVFERRFNSNLHLCYGCNNGTCEQTTKGDSGTPIVCALEKGDNPLINGVVVAVHSFGCRDVSEKCFPNGPSAGVDVRRISIWIELETMKRGNRNRASMYPCLIAAAVIVVFTYFY